MKGFVPKNAPYIVPTLDERLIEEHIGLAATGDTDLSLARMTAQPDWADVYQTPEFDEIIIMTKGKQLIEIDDETIELSIGQSYLVKKGSRVRYSNPYEEVNECWSVCIPAYTIETVNKEEEDYY